MNLYDRTVNYVNDAFKGKFLEHFERTVYWIERFIPDATEAQKIAAYSHDIERGMKGEKNRDYLNADVLKRHQEEGAEIMTAFLKQHGADEQTIYTVAHMISKHEVGGDMEQNALMDADSVSYFETNAEMFVNKKAAEDGYAKVKEKLDWMFDRISSEERKDFARKNYIEWSEALEKHKV